MSSRHRRHRARVFECAATPKAWEIEADARRMPMFEVDAPRPKMPAKWKLADASSSAIDAHDNVYVLHRPKTVKLQDTPPAAPAVVVFDANGNFVKHLVAVGGALDAPWGMVLAPADFGSLSGKLLVGGAYTDAKGKVAEQKEQRAAKRARRRAGTEDADDAEDAEDAEDA